MATSKGLSVASPSVSADGSVLSYSREELLNYQDSTANVDVSEIKFPKEMQKPHKALSVVLQEDLARRSKHQEMLEHVESGLMTYAVYMREMKRRKENKQLRVEARKKHLEVKNRKSRQVKEEAKPVEPVVQKESMQTFVLSTPHGNATFEVKVEKDPSSQEILNKPLTMKDFDKMNAIFAVGKPWWEQKMLELSEKIPSSEFEEKLNHHTYSPFKKGTVEYWIDLAWGSRRRRDKFISLMEMCLVEDEIACVQSDEPVLEETSALAGNANVTFVEERAVDTDSSHIAQSISANDTLMNMAETPWKEIVSVLGRELLVWRGEWTETTGREVFSLGIPQCITDVSESFVVSQLRVAAFLRAGVELRIQFNGNRFAAGSLVFCLLPPMFNEDAVGYTYLQSFNWPHVRIDAAVSNVGTLFVPFTHILSHFPQRAGSLESDSIATLGRLVVYCVNPLRVGEGASNVLNYTIYARFVNPEVHQTTWPITEFSYSDGLVVQAAEEGLFKRILGGGLGMALGNFLTKMTGGLATGFGSLLTGLIFDYPHDPMPPAPIVNTAVGPVCYGAGVDHSIRLTLTPVSQTETDPSLLGSSNGDFNLQTLLKIPSLVETFKWSNSHESGTRIFWMPVTPSWLSAVRVGSYKQETANYMPTMQAYISRAFCYWRGGLKLKLQFIKTEYNNGRVLVSYSPHINSEQFPSSSTMKTLEYYNQANAVVIDIEEQKEIVIDLPYMSPRPWLRCDALRTEADFVNNPDDPRSVMSYLGESFCGFVQVHVLNRLVSPSNVPQEIEVNAFVYVDDDFELAYPATLAPLNVSSFGQGAFNGHEEYPFALGTTESNQWDFEFENKHWLTALYFDGARLHAKGRLQIPPKPKEKAYWYYATPAYITGTTDEEAVVWCYKASMAAKYLDYTGPAPVQALFLQSLPNWNEEKIPTTQALEEYTTTRKSEPVAIVPTAGKRTCEAAPSTVSENAMNLQTILRRFYCIYNSYPMYAVSSYTVVSVPVNPSVVPIMRYPVRTNKVSGYGESLPIDQIAWFTKLYTYWRGSLRYKFVFDDSMFDVEAIHVPTECRKFSIVNGVKEIDVQRLMAYGSAITVSQVQGSLEVEVPYASPYNQLFVDVHNKYYDLRCQNGTLFFLFRNKQKFSRSDQVPTTFSLFRSTGEDFVFNILKAPPQIEEPMMFFGRCENNPTGYFITSPETARNLGDDSEKIALPGSTGIKKINKMGYFTYCNVVPDPPDAPPLAEVQVFEEFKEAGRNFNEVSKQMGDLVNSGVVHRVLQNVDIASQEIKSASASVNEVLQEVNLKETLQSLNCVSRKIDGMLDKTSSIAAGFVPENETLKRYALIASEVVLCGTFVHHVRTVLCEPSLPNFVTVAIEFGLIVGLTVSETLQSLVMRVVDWAMHFPVLKPEQARAQAFDGATDFLDDNCGVICTVVAVIGTVLYAYMFDALPSFSKIKDVIKSFFDSEDESPAKVQSLEKTLGFSLRNAHFSVLGITALEKVYNKLIEWIQKFIYWMLDKENPQVVLARAATELKDRVLKLIKELDDLDYEPNFIAALDDPLVHNRFYAMQDEVYELTNLCTESKVDQKVVMLLTECRRRACALIKRMEKERSSATTRYDPFVVCIHGETGVGKTKFAQKIFEVYQRVMDLPSNHMLYTKNIRDDYWSGYTNQPIVLWDEYGQSKEADKVAIPEFMTLRGDKPVKVNMAALEDKGRDFTSQGIVLTTNVPYQDYNSIRDNAAHKRRRHVMIGMQHKRDFDANVLQEANYNQFPNWEHCAFSITQNDRDEVIEHGMTMQAVLDHVEKKMRHWHENQMARLAGVRDEELPRGIVVNPAVSFDDLLSVGSERPVVEDVEHHLRINVDVAEERALFLNVEMDDFDADELVEEEIEDGYSTASEDEPVVQANENLPVFIINPEADLTADEWFLAEVFLARCEQMTPYELARRYRNYKRTILSAPSRLYNLAKKTFDGFTRLVSDFWTQNPKLCKVLGVVTLLTGVGAIMHFRGKAESEHYESGPARPAARKVLAETGYENGPKAGKHVKVLSEGSEDKQALEISRLVAQYVYPVGWCDGSVRNANLNCIHVGGRVILAPFHFFDHAKDGDFFQLKHRVNPVTVEFMKSKLVRLEDRDWCLYDCGPRLECGKKLDKFFIDENALGKVRTVDCVLLTRDAESFDICRDSGTAQAQQTFKYNDPKWGDTYTQTGWKHNLNTVNGQCGGPLILCSNALPSPGKIGGIHVAGYASKAVGYCVLVTRQLLLRALDKLSPLPGEPCVPQCVQRGLSEKLRVIPEGDFSIVGRMPDHLAPAQPLKTTFVETPFHDQVVEDFGEAPKRPAHLRPFVDKEGDRVSPLKNALVKYGYETKPFSLRNIRKVENFLVHLFDQKLVHHTGRRIFSIPEAVNGLPGVEFAEKMNMKSSAGWPFQMHDRRPGKWHLFDEEGHIVSEELQQKLAEREVAAKNLRRVESIWRDCMKDELRPLSKIVKGKTRLFTIAPVDFTILTRQYFLDFVMAFYSAHSENFFSAVGINPESPEWTDLYNYLAEYNTNVVAGDYECFDGKVMPEIIMSVCNVINAWYGDRTENQNVRETVFDEIVHTMQLCENLVYMTHQGNPSGNPLTTVLNTIVNFYLLALAWLEIFPNKSVDDFHQNVRVKAYGDDNLAAPKTVVAQEYNQNSIAQVLARHNIVYTSEVKDGVLTEDLRPLTEVTFLKRGFRKDLEFGSIFWLPVMSNETLNSYFYFYRQASEVQDQLQENQRSALLFASFQGRKFYNDYMRKWKVYMKSAGLESLHVSFEEQVDGFRYVAGMLDRKPRILTGPEMDIESEGMEQFMKATNSRVARALGGIVEAPFYYIAAALGILQSDVPREENDDRWAVAIPSGEGKSSLAKQFPWLFVDHDELLIPKFSESRTSLPWRAEVARKIDFPKEDRRVLLVHHPSFTSRKLVGSFVTPFPSFIRMNCIQRLRMNAPVRMPIEQRNVLLVQLCSSLEPTLKNVGD